MLIPVFLILSAAQSPAAPPAPDEQPVRVWFEPRAPGAGVRVYVETRVDGYVIVLRRGGDGTVEVLFPETPGRPAYVPAGTYEVVGSDGGAAFTVLAAVAPGPFRTGEFARGDSWDGDALAGWSGAGAEPALTELVQRMLGDESFNYDLATYAGAAPATVVAETVIVQAPPLLAAPLAFEGFGRRRSQRFQPAARHPASIAPTPALALYERGRLAAGPIVAAPAAPRAMLPPIVIVQRRVRSSPREPVPLTPGRLPFRRSLATPPATAVGTSAIAFVPSMPLALRPSVSRAEPVRAAPATPRTFALPHSVSAVVVPARRR